MTDRPKDTDGTVRYPDAWAGHVLDRPEPDLEDVMSDDALPGQISEAEKLRIWRDKFGSYDEQMTVSISRNAVRLGLITWARSNRTVITQQMGEDILSHIVGAMVVSQGTPTNG